MEVISTTNLVKEYGAKRVVDEVSLHVAAGGIYGFLGLNGAGKTTTIRMLLGMIKPTKGQADLFGKKVGSSNSIWNNKKTPEIS